MQHIVRIRCFLCGNSPNISQSVSPIPEVSVVITLQVANGPLFGLHFARHGSRWWTLTRSGTRNRPSALSLSSRLHRQRRGRRLHNIAPLLVTNTRPERLQSSRNLLEPVLVHLDVGVFFGDVLEVRRRLAGARRAFGGGNWRGRGGCLAFGRAAPRQTALPNPHQCDGWRLPQEITVVAASSPVARLTNTSTLGAKGGGGQTAD